MEFSVKKMWYIRTMEYYSALKKKKEDPAKSDNIDEPEGHYAK